MSEDSSSDEEWCALRKRKCWECGKKFSNIKSMMSHYKSHKNKATCHICQVTFQNLALLSTHLDNAHSPPVCKKCHQSFSDVWELNKHTESQCKGCIEKLASFLPAVIQLKQNSVRLSNQQTSQQCINTEPRRTRSQTKSQASEKSVNYVVGEEEDKDTENDCDDEDDSSSSESEDDVTSNSACYSSDTSAKNSVCSFCGRGPFRSLKIHLRHCTVKEKHRCSLCKELFETETSLNEHFMLLYTCEVCGQVFSQEKSYHDHQCPKASKSPLVLFCSESLPKACNICKSFFTSQKTLLNHVNRVHMSVVSTKVCIIAKPSAGTNKNVSHGVNGSAAQSSLKSSVVASQVINGKFRVDQASAGSPTAVVKPVPSVSTTSPLTDTSPIPVCLISAPKRVAPGKDSTSGRPTSQNFSSPSPANVAADPVSPPMPTILALFENSSHKISLMKRMNTGWRFKAPHPCRQCGVIFRQPSLIISHRYRHRGRRLHKCQCGRAFKQRLHLLRHCVQHAETVNYICVSCGETFTGANLLAQHINGKSGNKSRSGRKCKLKVKRTCTAPFTCDCGQHFFRPSAYIWHQLQNNIKTKQSKCS